MPRKTDGQVARRQEPQKAAIIEQLRKTPIVQIACDKAGVGRATYYRWLEDDAEFAGLAGKAMLEGNGLVSDAAESQMVNLIRNGNLGAITFWLKHRHPAYRSRLEIDARVAHDDGSLTDEEAATVRRALELMALTEGKNHVQEKADGKPDAG
jgi:hypothetical protein